MTKTQEEIWHLHQDLPCPEVLNMFYALAVEGPLDAAALERALRSLCRRHQPLRTCYPRLHGGPVAQVRDEVDLLWERVDLAPLGPARGWAQAARCAAREAHRPFHLDRGPLIRAALLTLGDESHVLLLNLHHICADGWSLDIFGRECSTLYAACRGGGAPALDELTFQCIDHAEWQAAWLDGAAGRGELEWWEGYLQGAPPSAFTLPTDRPRGAGFSLATSRQTVLLPGDLMDEIRGWARRRGASLFMVFLGALQALIGRWAQIGEVVVGTLVANRGTPTAGRILGAHYNPLLLRTSLAEEPPLAEILMRVVESSLPALEHQATPFTQVTQTLRTEPGTDPRSLPRAMLLLDLYPLHGLRLDGATVTGLHLDEAGATTAEELASPRRLLTPTNADLTFFLREVAGRVTLSVFYKTERLADSTVERLVRSYLEILLAMTEDLAEPFSDLPLPLPDPSTEGRRVGDGSAGPNRRRNPSLVPITTISPVDALSPVTCLATP